MGVLEYRVRKERNLRTRYRFCGCRVFLRIVLGTNNRACLQPCGRNLQFNSASWQPLNPLF